VTSELCRDDLVSSVQSPLWGCRAERRVVDGAVEGMRKVSAFTVARESTLYRAAVRRRMTRAAEEVVMVVVVVWL